MPSLRRLVAIAVLLAFGQFSGNGDEEAHERICHDPYPTKHYCR